MLSLHLGQIDNQDVAENARLERAQIELRLQNLIRAEREALSGLPTTMRPDTLSFESWTVEAPIPYLVAYQDSLIYWSDNQAHLGVSQVMGPKRELVRNPSGVFLVERAERGGVTILSVLEIERQYSFENQYLNNGLNPQLFNRLDGTIGKSPTISAWPIRLAGKTIFYVQPQGSAPSGQRISDLAAWLTLLGLVLLLVGGAACFVWLRRRWPLVSLLFLCMGLLGIRLLLIAYDFPFSWRDWDLFSPLFYASALVAPSMGDLLLNTLFFALLVGESLRQLARYRPLRRFRRPPGGVYRAIIALLVVVAAQGLVIWMSDFFLGLFEHSQVEFDLTRNVRFGQYHAVYMVLFLVVATLLFLGLHFLVQFFSVLYRPNRLTGYVLIFGGSLWALVAFWGISEGSWQAIAVGALYIGVSYGKRLHQTLRHFRYISYLYLIMGGCLAALIAAFALSEHSRRSATLYKEDFAEQLYLEGDPLAEFLLEDAAQKVEFDPFLAEVILSPMARKGTIAQKISRVHLSNYFDQYEIRVDVFDAKGNSIFFSNHPERGIDYYDRFEAPEFATEYEGLYIVRQFDKYGVKRYLKMIPIRRDSFLVGHVALDLRLKKILPSSVFPRLLVDNRLLESYYENDYNYAVYNGSELLYSFGSFHYQSRFLDRLLPHVSEGHQTELDGYLHYHTLGSQGEHIVVSTEDRRWIGLLSNFSLLFLWAVMAVTLWLGALSLALRARRRQTQLSTRIQLVLSITYLLPLLIITLASIGAINSNYKRDLLNDFGEKAEGVGYNLVTLVDRFRENDLDLEGFRAAIKQVGRFTESDINFYGTSGMLLASSQPIVFEGGLLPELINPLAYERIIDQGERKVILSEQVGRLDYNVVYLALRSNQDGGLVGVMSLPFYNAAYDLESKKSNVVGTILNIFVAIFLFFLVVAYVAARGLTRPLGMIAAKLKRTSFAAQNEKIDWTIDDEVGLLVREYNSMLDKLEESRVALARSEKESAWREMARQVAHEIKNPLTPMKLSLQHLQQRMLMEGRGDEAAHKTIQTLLVQIETLSDIATSFSSFAQMPTPISERFDWAEVAREVVALHTKDERVHVNLEAAEGPCFVWGDRKLMGRILTNLILNGIQAVPSDTEPHLQVRLREEADYAVMEVTDNGQGIPEDIRHKVFLPNFSTKFSGSGLGLALAKRGVEHAGGEISFESREGEGTTFTVTLPRAQQR